MVTPKIQIDNQIQLIEKRDVGLKQFYLECQLDFLKLYELVGRQFGVAHLDIPLLKMGESVAENGPSE